MREMRVNLKSYKAYFCFLHFDALLKKLQWNSEVKFSPKEQILDMILMYD